MFEQRIRLVVATVDGSEKFPPPPHPQFFSLSRDMSQGQKEEEGESSGG